MKHSLSDRLRVFPLLIASLAIQGICVQAQQTSTPAPPQPPPGAPPAQAGLNPPPPLAPSQEPPIKVTTGLVHLVVTVMDHRHAFITDLDKSDFKVLENGTPQDIRFFGRETDLPLRIGLLLDTSNSIRPRLEFEKDAAVDFLNKTLRRNKDMAFLMTFDNEPQVIQDYTGDLALLTAAINEQRAGGGTALNDAIYMASEKLSHAPPPKGDESDMRRVVVLISDGNDNLSDRALSEAIDASIRSEASVYTVSTNTDWLSVDDARKPSKYNMDTGDKILQQFADQTGGQAFFPYRIDDLAESFFEIGTELRSQYFIAYSPILPATKGEYRKIEVQTARKGLIVRTRKGYYAVPPPSSNGAQ
ncbi:MAG: VWA domain-containing protein [Candidatus Acidiferrales bacterium]|jgi:VWFA-related protein